MKILRFSNFFPPTPTGSAHHAYQLSRKLVQMGHEVTVITTSLTRSTTEEILDGIKVYRLGSYGYPRIGFFLNYSLRYVLTPSNVRFVRGLMKSEKFDLVHCHGQMFDTSWLGVLCAKREKIKSVLTIHAYMLHPKALINAIFVLADKLFLRFIVNRFDALILRDFAGLEYARTRYNFNPQGSRLIFGGIDPQRLREEASLEPIDDDIKQWKAEGCFIISSIGHLQQFRDRMVLFKALEIVKRETSNVRVVIVGDVLYPDSLEYARERGLGDHIKVYGRCEHKKALSIINQCDAEIHDLDGYGVGIADQEAMALGKTVVVGGREDNFGPGILKNWENIVIFPPSDHAALAQAILKLIKDPSLRERIAEGAGQIIEERFTWDANTHKTVELYNTILNN